LNVILFIPKINFDLYQINDEDEDYTELTQQLFEILGFKMRQIEIPNVGITNKSSESFLLRITKPLYE
jgi:hypothetical protein